jgi:hypothetical protein
MAAQAPTKQPFQPVSETRRAFPIRGILDGFFNDIGAKATAGIDELR